MPIHTLNIASAANAADGLYRKCLYRQGMAPGGWTVALGVLLASIWPAPPAGADSLPCALNRVAINPIGPGRTDVFVGRTDTLELRFQSERDDPAVEVFPEPPLVVKHIKSGTQCAIDGGIWVRRSVYIDTQDRLLLTEEYSGANAFLKLYDPATCRRIAVIDIAHSTWTVDGARLTLSAVAAPAAPAARPGRSSGVARVLQLDARCRLQKK